MVSIDNFTAFFRFLFIGVAIVLIVGSHEYIERHVLLQAVDRNWQNHLTDMDELRRAVNLRSYAQKDPLNEYKSEAYRAFAELMGQLREDVCRKLFRLASSMEALEALVRRAQGQAVATGPAEPGAPTPTTAAPPTERPDSVANVTPSVPFTSGITMPMATRRKPNTRRLRALLATVTPRSMRNSVSAP